MSLEYLKRALYITLSKILLNIGSRLTGWCSLLGVCPHFLCTGTIFVFVHAFGYFFSFNDCSNIIFKGAVIDSPQILIIFIDILSQLDESKVFIISSMPSLVKWNEVILAFVLCKKVGKILVFCIGVHIDKKNY